MKAGIDALEAGIDQPRIDHRAVAKLEVGAAIMLGEVEFVAGAQIIEDDDLVAAPNQSVDDV